MVFAQEDLPISMALLIDMSASMKPNLNLVRKAAARLIAQLRPEDRAQVIEFSDRPNVLQEFTSDQAALLSAIDRVRPGGTTALHNVLYITLKDVATLSKTEGMRRRAIVLLSDGEDTASMVTDDQVLEAARACEINVYSILLGAGAKNTPGAPVQARFLLSALARESGGVAFFPQSPAELGRLYERVAQELRSQYSIGYVSSKPDYDGSWRQILVLTPQHDQLNIRHRLGYYAVPDAPLPRAKTSDARLGGPSSGRP
jgi:VWFA-related protein